MPDPQEDRDRQAIIDAIADECDAFYARDYPRWASHWFQHEDTRRLGTLAGGQVDYKQGWEAEATMMERMMRDHPTPNLDASALVRRENMMVRISGDMAWACFDQHTPRSEDIFINTGLSHQIRVFERHDGDWKVVFAAHGDTRLEYFDFPTIRVDAMGSLLWMNGSARSALGNHPVLTQSAGTLRGRTRANDRELRKTFAQIADLTPLDIRQSVSSDGGNTSSLPVVLEDGESDALHLVWVSHLDGMVLVTFNDQATEDQRLESAQSIFGMSNAQMQIAALIVGGNDLRQAADHLGISINTARTQLQRMFDKTRVRSQTALVRLLLSSAAPVG